MTDPIKVYSLVEVGNLLGVGYQSLRKFIKRGDIKARKVGTKWIITENALKEYLESGNQKEKI